MTISRASTDYAFTPLFYPHRTTDGNVILLLRAGTDLRRFGGVTLEELSTYENTIPEGFHIFNLGALSESPTFTLGNEAAQLPDGHRDAPETYRRSRFFLLFPHRLRTRGRVPLSPHLELGISDYFTFIFIFFTQNTRVAHCYLFNIWYNVS